MASRSAVRSALLTFAIGIAGSLPAFALEQKAYDAAAFKSAQDAGAATVIHITAPWCSTCTAQHAAIDSLTAKPEYKDVTLFKVDFDSQQDVLRSFNARSQSTIIAYKGSQETARVVGATDPAVIEDTISSTTK